MYIEYWFVHYMYPWSTRDQTMYTTYKSDTYDLQCLEVLKYKGNCVPKYICVLQSQVFTCLCLLEYNKGKVNQIEIIII